MASMSVTLSPASDSKYLTISGGPMNRHSSKSLHSWTRKLWLPTCESISEVRLNGMGRLEKGDGNDLVKAPQGAEASLSVCKIEQ